MDPPEVLDGVTHVLLSIPPGDGGDPAYQHHAEQIAATESVNWVGYLSTTGVYGNRDGGWVDEGSDLRQAARAASDASMQNGRGWIGEIVTG